MFSFQVSSIFMFDCLCRQTLHNAARLAIEMRYLPEWEINWDDDTPQRDLATVTIF